MATRKNKEVCCSFCGRPQSEVLNLIDGGGVYICNDCVNVCDVVLDSNMQMGYHEHDIKIDFKSPMYDNLRMQLRAMRDERLEQSAQEQDDNDFEPESATDEVSSSFVGRICLLKTTSIPVILPAEAPFVQKSVEISIKE